MRRLVLHLALAIAAAIPAVAAPHLVHRAFSSAEPQTPEHAIRAAFVVPDLAPLEAPWLAVGERKAVDLEIAAPLFADAMPTLVFDHVERDAIGSVIWTGRVAGEPLSSATVSLHGGALSASIATPAHRFAIDPAKNGLHEVVEVDGRTFPDDGDDLPIAPAPARVSSAAIAQTTRDSGAIIDVLVAYTARVTGVAGSSDAVNAKISAAIADGNLAFANSHVVPRLRLIGTMETDYDDGSGTFRNALDRVTNTDDGVMDEVPMVRNGKAADAVTLLVLNPTDSLCGTGWIMSQGTDPGPRPEFESHAYNVVKYTCIDNLSVPHELGHNFGLQHDRNNAGTVKPSYPWAYGYQDPSGRFRDVMAYSTYCPGACTRLPYFSNPEVTYDGAPFGVSYLETYSADNARALNANAAVIANFRVAAIPVSGGPRRRAVGH